MKRPVVTILALNLLLILLAAAFAYFGNARTDDAAIVMFLLLVPLWLLNGVALFVTLFRLPGSKRYFEALLLSTLLILIVGLGVCGVSASNLSIH